MITYRAAGRYRFYIILGLLFLFSVPVFAEDEVESVRERVLAEEKVIDDVDIIGNEEDELFEELDQIIMKDVDVLFQDEFSDEDTTEREPAPVVMTEEITEDSHDGETPLIESNADALINE